MAFLFRLETADGALAEPPTLTSAVPNWRPGDYRARASPIPLCVSPLQNYPPSTREERPQRGRSSLVLACAPAAIRSAGRGSTGRRC
jgi:hypothetical protein